MYFNIILLYASAALHLVKLEKVTSKLHNYTTLDDLIAYQSIVLKGEVTVQEESNAEYNYLKLEAKFEGTEQFHQFYVLSLNECVQNDSFNCVKDENKFHISATITAIPSLNQSEWILTGEYNNETFQSNVITLPNIKPTVEASLLEYNFSNLNCQNYLLMDNTFVLEGMVRVNKNSEKSEGYFSIEWGQNNLTFEIFYTISLAQCGSPSSPSNYDFTITFFKLHIAFYTISLAQCGSPSSLSCSKEGNVYKLHLIMLAKSNLSQSLWRITGRYNDVEFTSNTIKLPESFDLSKVVMTLNGQTLSPSNISLTIKDDEELALCCEFAPSPCKAVITLDHSRSVSDLNCVHYRPSQSVETTYTFGYIVCGNDTFSEVFTIAIIIKAVHDGVSLGIKLTIVFVALAFIVLSIVSICCYYRVKNRKQNPPANSSSGEPLVPRLHVNNSIDQENRNSVTFNMEAVSSDSDGETEGREVKATQVNLLIPESETMQYLRSRQNTRSTQTTVIKRNRKITEMPLVDRITRSKQKEFDDKIAKMTKSPSPRRRRISKQKGFSEDIDAKVLTFPISASIGRKKPKEFNAIYPDFDTPKIKNTEIKKRFSEHITESKQTEFDEKNVQMMDYYQSYGKVKSKDLRIRRMQTVQQ